MKEEVDRRGGGGVGEEKWRRDLETEEVGWGGGEKRM